MRHSITFIDGNIKRNTLKDFHIVATELPFFNPPQIKRETKEIPGSDIVLDYSKAVSGTYNYTNRTGEIEFKIEKRNAKLETYSELTQFLNKNLKAVLDEEKGFYYEGFFEVTEISSDELYSYATISYDLFPWKQRIEETAVSKAVNGTTKIICRNLMKRVCPVFKSDAEITVNFGSTSFIVPPDPKGRQFPIFFEQGDNELTIEGNGNLEIAYREGCL